MELYESPLLSKELLAARVADRDFDPAAWESGREAVLRLRDETLLLRQGEWVVTLQQVPEAGSLGFLAQNLDVLWLLTRVKSGRVWLQYLAPLQRCSPEGGLAMGADQRVADSLYQLKLIDYPEVADAVAWLSAEFLCPTDDGGKVRAFMTQHARLDRQQMQLIGRDYVVDLRRDPQQALLVERVTRRRRSSELQAFVLLEGDIRFADVRHGLQVQDEAQRAAMEAAVTGFNTYLELWKLYGHKEWERDVRRAAELGALSYNGCVPASDEGGGWRLQVKPAALQAFRERWRANCTDDDQLETDQDAPAWDDERYTDLSQRDKRRLFRSHPRWQKDCLVLEGESGVRPPETGYVFLSLAGNRTQHERRWRARQAIEAGLGVKSLRLLLQDLPTPTERPSRLTALTSYARQSFRGGSPTPRQKDALAVALNTPDVALIIGPPGTGKTQVIAALERRLAELGEGGSLAQQVLVSSFQHDAVENALERTNVLGLPAVKVGGSSRREGTDPVETWRLSRLQRLNEQLQRMEHEEPVQVLLRRFNGLLNRLLVLGAPPAQRSELFGELEALLSQLGDEARIRPSSRWRADWEAYRDETGSKRAEPNHELTPESRHRLTRAVRSLRTHPASFADDGPMRARTVLALLLDVQGMLAEHDEALLREAAIQGDESPSLAELAALRDLLLDRLRPDPRPTAMRERLDAQAQVLLQRLRDELADKVAEGRYGRFGVLERYRDAFAAHPGWVRRAVENYSSIVGATCQQAASQTMSLLKNASPNAPGGIRFESVIIDEAARANPLDLFVPMAMARRRIVLVGDHRQLPHLLDAEIEEEVQAERGSQADSEVYRNSLFERLWRQLKRREQTDGYTRVVMLDTQFRMHPRLGDFVSRQFYEAAGLGRVHSGRKAEDFTLQVPGYGDAVCAWLDVPAARGGDERSGTSRRRMPEAHRVAAEVQRLLQSLPEEASVGVITFYAAQRDAIFQAMEEMGLTERGEAGWRVRPEHAANARCTERLRVGTVDAFQGKEFDVVLLSVVRSNASPLGLPGSNEDADWEKAASRRYGHLRSSNRLNVAMSRQRRLLLAVGDQEMFRGDAAYAAVPEMCAFLGFCQEEARHVGT